MRICIFGDSIVWGACDYKCGGWVERLKTYLLKNNDDVEVYNFGVSGNKTGDVVARFDQEALIMKPELVVFAVGINDSQFTSLKKDPVIDPAAFEVNIQTLIDKARKISNRILFIGLTKVDETKVQPRIHRPKIKYYGNNNIKKFDLIISDVCNRNGVTFVSTFDLFGVDGLEDGLHPNSSGHTKMFEKIKPEVEKLLANLKQ